MRPADADVILEEGVLVPAIVQDEATGDVLMLAYMDAEALEATRATGLAHFHSRSRDELWQKGATSGNTMEVHDLAFDCDCDTILLRVRPAGPACHTGERTCFFRAADGAPQPVAHEALPALERTIDARRAERPEGSYTVRLLDDPALVGAKVREEADEVARAVAGESDERVAEEAADLLYHLEVALASRGLGIEAPATVLNARRRDG